MMAKVFNHTASLLLVTKDGLRCGICGEKVESVAQYRSKEPKVWTDFKVIGSWDNEKDETKYEYRDGYRCKNGHESAWQNRPEYPEYKEEK
jgi:hypothetical protein